MGGLHEAGRWSRVGSQPSEGLSKMPREPRRGPSLGIGLDQASWQMGARGVWPWREGVSGRDHRARVLSARRSRRKCHCGGHHGPRTRQPWRCRVGWGRGAGGATVPVRLCFQHPSRTHAASRAGPAVCTPPPGLC